MQTRENRIMRHYDSLKNSTDYRRESVGAAWMILAMRWGMPISKLKEIVKNERARVQNDA